MTIASGRSTPALPRSGRRLLPGQAEQEGDLHVGGLTCGGVFHRGGVFVAVDEHQARRSGGTGQRGHRRQQHGTVSAVNQREVPAGQGRSHTVIEGGHHFQQGALVQEANRPRAATGGETTTSGAGPARPASAVTRPAPRRAAGASACPQARPEPSKHTPISSMPPAASGILPACCSVIWVASPKTDARDGPI
jgi:hypothetical protein